MFVTQQSVACVHSYYMVLLNKAVIKGECRRGVCGGCEGECVYCYSMDVRVRGERVYVFVTQ